MAPGRPDAKVKIKGDNESLKRAIRDSEGSLTRFAGGAVKGGAVALGGFAVAGAAAGAGLLSLGNNLKEAENTIRLGTGATGDSLAALVDEFEDLAVRVPEGFDVTSTALADVNTRLGITGDQLENTSLAFIRFSRVAGEDVSASIERATRVMGDLGLPAEDAEKTLDLLWVTSQNTGIGVDELADKLVQFGAPLRTMGFSVEESAALLGQFNKEGVNTETIFSGLKTGIGKLASEGANVPAEMERIFTSIQNAGTMSEATGIAIAAFGQRSGPDLADAIRGGRFEIDELVSTIENSEETVAKAAADTLTWTDHLDRFKNVAGIALAPLASGLVEAFGDALEGATPFLLELGEGLRTVSETISEDGLGAGLELLGEKFEEVWPIAREHLGNFLQSAKGWLADNGPTILGAVADAVGSAISGLGQLIDEHAPDVQKALISGLQALGEGVKREGPNILRGIRDGAITAIREIAVWMATESLPLTLEGAFTLLKGLDNWARNDVAPAIAGWVSDWAISLGNWITDEAWPFLKENLPIYLRDLGDWIVNTAAPTVATKAIEMATALGRTWVTKAIPFMFVELPKLLARYATWVTTSAAPFVISKGQQIANAFARWIIDAGSALPGQLLGLTQRFNTWQSGLVSNLLSRGASMFDFLPRAFKSALNKVIDAWNRLDFEVNVSIPSFIPGVGGNSFNSGDIFPDVPRLAAGGVVSRPTLAVVGDTPNDSEIVAPTNMIRDIINEALGNNQQPMLLRVELDGRVLAEQMVQHLRTLEFTRR